MMTKQEFLALSEQEQRGVVANYMVGQIDFEGLYEMAISYFVDLYNNKEFSDWEVDKEEYLEVMGGD